LVDDVIDFVRGIGLDQLFDVDSDRDASASGAPSEALMDFIVHGGADVLSWEAHYRNAAWVDRSIGEAVSTAPPEKLVRRLCAAR
jgi:hypothetical protein